MSLHLYDSASRSVREFVPLEPGRASMYLCGATVQAPMEPVAQVRLSTQVPPRSVQSLCALPSLKPVS